MMFCTECKRESSQESHFRHTAYRVIDRELATLESKGKLEDLKELEKLLPTVTDEAVQDRIAWTIRSIRPLKLEVGQFCKEQGR